MKLSVKMISGRLFFPFMCKFKGKKHVIKIKGNFLKYFFSLKFFFPVRITHK